MKIMMRNNNNRVSATAYCVREKKACNIWVEKYFKDCLCNIGDELSFVFGLISLVCWGVAEIPQIISNFNSKSSHGVSLLFLLTWIVGDMFNLVGCFLEPATLPTQYYTAWLYTASTILLVSQTVYYDYVYKWLGKRRNDDKQEIEDVKRPLMDPTTTSVVDSRSSTIPTGGSSGTTVIKASPRREHYYTSARSLAGSATPPVKSFLWPVSSGPPAFSIPNDSSSSSDDEESGMTREQTSTTTTHPRPIASSAGVGAFLATSLGLPTHTNAMMHVFTGLTAINSLQEGQGENVVGQWLGWMMAAIYMGGRIPQIVLNIKRGNVEGLNPFMFILALVANVTYVASILLRSIEWEKIRANLPWLLDAVACVALDLFIISQYVYYKNRSNKMQRSRDHHHKHGDGANFEANKN